MQNTFFNGAFFMIETIAANSVEQNAYNLFVARGQVHGHDQEDWFAAEISAHEHHDKFSTQKRSKHHRQDK